MPQPRSAPACAAYGREPQRRKPARAALRAHTSPSVRTTPPLRAESALDARERSTAKRGATGASQEPGCCKHQSSSPPAGGGAAGCGQIQPRDRGGPLFDGPWACATSPACRANGGRRQRRRDAPRERQSRSPRERPVTSAPASSRRSSSRGSAGPAGSRRRRSRSRRDDARSQIWRATGSGQPSPNRDDYRVDDGHGRDDVS